jgi:Tfp pilus assembly protein PilO
MLGLIKEPKIINTMKQKFLYIALAIVLLCLLVWKFVINANVADNKNKSANQTFEVTNIFKEFENSDVTSLKKYENQLIAIKGKIKNINKDGELITVIMQQDSNMNSINFQMDKRYAKEITNLVINSTQTIQGIFAGYAADDGLGIGNTIQLKYCTINNN